MKTLFLFCIVIASFIPDSGLILAGKVGTTPIVSLAFDDGRKNQFINALPVLDSIGYKGSFYIITKYLTDTNPSFVDLNQVLKLYNDGQEIESHSRDHLNLGFCWPWTAKYEIEQSKRDLNIIGIKAASFAYPDGGSNFLSRYYVQQAGYTNGRGAPRDGYNGMNTDRYNLSCKYVLNSTTINEISGWVDEAARKGYWLILLFHAINQSESPYKFSCTRSTFKDACLYLKAKNVTVLPVSQAFKKYFPASIPEN